MKILVLISHTYYIYQISVLNVRLRILSVLKKGRRKPFCLFLMFKVSVVLFFEEASRTKLLLLLDGWLQNCAINASDYAPPKGIELQNESVYRVV